MPVCAHYASSHDHQDGFRPGKLVRKLISKQKEKA